jgi:hypothetical protein
MKDNYLDYQTFKSKAQQYECEILKMDIIYHLSDHRCWSAIINPGKENIIVTYGINKYGPGTRYFDVITSDRIYSDVYQDDIYALLESFLGKGITTIYFDLNQNEQSH